MAESLATLLPAVTGEVENVPSEPGDLADGIANWSVKVVLVSACCL